MKTQKKIAKESISLTEEIEKRITETNKLMQAGGIVDEKACSDIEQVNEKLSLNKKKTSEAIDRLLAVVAKRRILDSIERIKNSSVENGMIFIPNTKEWAIFKCSAALDLLNDSTLFIKPYGDKEFMTEGDVLAEEWEMTVNELIEKVSAAQAKTCES